MEKDKRNKNNNKLKITKNLPDRNSNKIPGPENILVFGGAGFIGTNVSKHFLNKGSRVTVFDNLSRRGVEENLKWLRGNYKENLEVITGDIRDYDLVFSAVSKNDAVFNFAAQVAVTTSLIDPRADFEINTGGTFNILESIRRSGREIPLFYTSTNKVYGALNNLKLYEGESRYTPIENTIRQNGVGENFPLDFHSPYGCSKGSADQYVLDYSRSYNIPTVVFRMSCIYGTHQFGNEDQGWVAHFMINALNNKQINIFGDGKQVRDILFVDDLVNGFQRALDNIELVKGMAFNIGGGTESSISLVELIDKIEEKLNKKVKIQFDDWRTGDQKYYVSDTTKFSGLSGWKPEHSIDEGLDKLISWLISSNTINRPLTHSKVLRTIKRKGAVI